MSSTPLRIGILSTATVARSFIDAVKSSSLVAVRGVAGRNFAKAKAFAEEQGVARAYGSYEDLLKDPEIDAIYLPLPNSLHAEWGIRAAEAGKHVLCEKPLCVSAAEAKAMFAAARANGVHLVEGYPYLAQPQTIEMRKLLRAGAIGDVQFIQTSFGFKMPDPQSNIRMDASLGGGALLDAGSYAVSLVRVAAGERPSRVLATATWFGEGVERTLIASLEFPSGILAQIGCSFDTGFHRHAFIGGNAGAILTDYSNHAPPAGVLALHVKRSTGFVPYETVQIPGTSGFLAEAEAFAGLVSGRTDAWSGATQEESLDIMLTIDAIAKSARTRSWVDVEA